MPSTNKLRELLLFLVSLGIVWLLLAGIGGLSYEVFRDGSVVAKTGGKFIDYLWAKPAMLIPTVLGTIAVFYFWRRGDLDLGRKNPPSITLLIILLACAGAYYTYRLLRLL
jgi:hypothetical protein